MDKENVSAATPEPTAAADALKRLKRKWFLDPSAPVTTLPPTSRHAGTAVSVSTDGNLVTPLIDGEMYMRRWADAIADVSQQQRPEVWHTGLAMDNVGVRGKTVQGWGALERLVLAHAAGVDVFGMLSDHGYYGNDENKQTIQWLFKRGLQNVRRDPRYPNLAIGGLCCGSNHQKFACIRGVARSLALIGSADLHTGRWDSARHASPNGDRYGKPTHEVGAMIEGPAVADLEITFLERWNDPTRTRLIPPLVPPPPITVAPQAATTARGPHSVQVLHTYGQTSRGYSWSPAGEFTIWASYLNAIRRAESYISIEDQYFFPFAFPPLFLEPPGPARESDIVYQLGEAIRRGVKVIVIVPSATEEAGPIPRFQRYQRDIGVAYLQSVATSVGRPDDFTIASLANGAEDIFVHAKLMIVDDEFVLMGSANVNQKSMAHDSEVEIGVVDADGRFAKALRVSLWTEHLATAAENVDKPMDGYARMLAASRRAQPTGHVRSYAVNLTRPHGHRQAIARIDPYAGPRR